MSPQTPLSPHYKWIALSNTTLGILMATINSSIVLIALPDIFRGIHLNPLGVGNSSYLLWMIMGFLVATAVLVVSFGRVGDIYGRVRMFTLGFAIFTVFSVLLSITWMHGGAGAMWMIIMRIGQGIGGAFLEEMAYDDAGQLLSGTFMDYLLPGFTDVPDVDIYHLETPSPINVGGFKGMGEGGCINVMPAIANAVIDALKPIGEVQINTSPITAERVLAQVREARRHNGGGGHGNGSTR